MRVVRWFGRVQRRFGSNMNGYGNLALKEEEKDQRRSGVRVNDVEDWVK